MDCCISTDSTYFVTEKSRLFASNAVLVMDRLTLMCQEDVM